MAADTGFGFHSPSYKSVGCWFFVFCGFFFFVVVSIASCQRKLKNAEAVLEGQ